MKSKNVTRFVKALTSLRADDAPKYYANVSNLLQVTHKGRDYEVCVEVGTKLFTVMRMLNIPITSDVLMFLEDDGSKMLFGIMVGEEEVHDLWHYTSDRVPPEILNPLTSSRRARGN